MISDFRDIIIFFEEVGKHLKNKVHFFIIGGAMLLYYEIKSATKDIDVVVITKEEFSEIGKALLKINFESQIITDTHKRLNLSQIFTREDYHIDLFQKIVCDKFAFSENMIKRATKIFDTNNSTVSLCSKEDAFLFKSFTEREGDIEDCISLAKRGIDWKIIENELIYQIKQSGKGIWITWIGERFDLLEERGLTIPIMKQINKMRHDFMNEFEKKFNSENFR
jgi:predicted nucleotidyltransferase